MTTKQAIKWFESREKYYIIGDTCAKAEKVALEALREKDARETQQKIERKKIERSK